MSAISPPVRPAPAAEDSARARGVAPRAAPDGLEIAYLVNQYPGISHSFIRREIAALERRRVRVRRFALRPPKAGVLSSEDEAEAALTRSIVDHPKAALAGAILSALAARPGASAGALAKALRMAAPSEAGIVRHLIYFAEAAALARWMRSAGLAHVHAHFGTNSATVALLAARIAGAGFSMTVHGPEEFDKPGLIALAEKIRAARFVAAVSSYGASQLRRLVAPEFWDRIKIVRCGVEKAFYAAPPPPPAAGRFVSVARLCEQKGQLTLVAAASRLKSAGRDFKIALVGDGEMRGAIADAARRAGVLDRLEFLGWRTPGEVRAEIGKAIAFVLPSYAEGLPVSIMEAMSLGRPVISTYVAGVPELVEPGATGWLAPAGDADALAAAMGEALDLAPERRAAMGARARARIAADHDIDQIAGELAGHFAAALGGAPA
jgi:glycosyltransferase involved in cell wall biosynthesis